MYHDLLASSTKPRVPAVSRNWQSVSKDIQKLAAGVLVVKNEGMFPYETHYVLATDEEVEQLGAERFLEVLRWNEEAEDNTARFETRIAEWPLYKWML
jgi:hypothetical protein